MCVCVYVFVCEYTSIFVAIFQKHDKPSHICDKVKISVTVEIEDDTVVQAVQALKKVPMKLDHVPALTDKTFPKHRDGDTSVVMFYFPCMYFLLGVIGNQ